LAYGEHRSRGREEGSKPALRLRKIARKHKKDVIYTEQTEDSFVDNTPG
jgi:hypothetical protein